MNTRFVIYALHHPNSARVYVGKSSAGLRRPQQHSQPANLRRSAHHPCAKWIVSLQKRGLQPKIVVLEECASKDALNEAERFHIAYFRAIGMRLLNLTDGGDGGGWAPSAETRSRMSWSATKHARTKEGHKQRCESSRNYWADDVARERQRAERTGKKWSDETRAKISASSKGKPKSVEHRANLAIAASAAMKLRWQDPVYRAQHTEAARKRAQDSSLRKKISEATKAALARKRDPK